MVAPPTAPAATTASAMALSRGDVVGSSSTGAFSTTSEATTTSFGDDAPLSGVISSDRSETADPELPSTRDRGTSRDSPPQHAGIASSGILSANNLSRTFFWSVPRIATLEVVTGSNQLLMTTHIIVKYFGALTCAEIKFYGTFALNRRVDLHAIDATLARWRGDAGSSPDSLVDFHTGIDDVRPPRDLRIT